MRDRIWLSFDLGQPGDRPGLYQWLAGHKARECGPFLASLMYFYNDDMIEELKADLMGHIDLKPGDRVYLIYKDHYDGEMTGLFIIGNRAAKGPAESSPHQLYTSLQ